MMRNEENNDNWPQLKLDCKLYFQKSLYFRHIQFCQDIIIYVQQSQQWLQVIDNHDKSYLLLNGFTFNNNIYLIKVQPREAMFEQNEAEQFLRNYSQETEYDYNWFENNTLAKCSIKKASSSGKLTMMQTGFRNLASNHKPSNTDSARQKQGSERQENKKSSLPQIAFPLLGGSNHHIGHCQSTKNHKRMLTNKFLHYQPQTDRESQNKFIQRVIEKQAEKIRASENSDRYQIKENNFISKNYQFQQENKGAFRNYKSLRKTNKMKRTDGNGIRYTIKASSQQKERKIGNKLSLVDLFKKIQ